MDFSYSDKVKTLEARLLRFMNEHVYPSERRYHAEIAANRAAGNAWVPTRLIEELKPKARAEGLWNLFLPRSPRAPEGLSNLEYARFAKSWEGALGSGSVQLLGARYRKHGNAGAIRQRGTEAALARSAALGRDPVGVPNDRARRGVFGCDNIQCRIERHGGDYLVNGRKCGPPVPAIRAARFSS